MSKRNRKKRQVGRKPIKESKAQFSPPMAHISVPAHQGDLTETASYEQDPQGTAPVTLTPLSAAAPAFTGDAEANVPAVWEKGDVILDLYEIKEIHKGGGMGLVYRVHHRS